jgi:DNA-binding SARP family transcriptional activator/DNA-binding beta-propeller fold protein YncE
MEFRLLGPLEIVADSTPLSVGGQKQRALVAFLLLRANEVVVRETLIDALWGAEPPDSAWQAVAVYVSRLRALLREHRSHARVMTRGTGYVLELELEELDLHRFEELAKEGRRALQLGNAPHAATALADALAIWRGPALADLGDEPFVSVERQRLEEARLAALEDRIEADLALGAGAPLVSELTQLVHDHPYRECLREQLMLALYRSGRQSEALDVYRETRRRLVDELGIEPGEELQQLHRRILSHDEVLLPDAGRGRGRADGGRVSRAAASAWPVAGRIVRRHRLLATGVTATAVAAIVLVFAIFGESSRAPARSAPVDVLANSLVKLDPVSGRVLASVRVGDRPSAIALGPGAVWVVNRGDRTVSRVDTETARVRTVGGAVFAEDVAADSHGNVWISGARDRLVTRITSGSQGFPAEPAVPEGIHVPFHAGALAVGGGYLWVVNAGFATPPGAYEPVEVGKDSVTRIDLRSHRPASRIRVGRSPFAVGFGYGSAWVVNMGSNSLSVIRTGSEKPQSIPLPLDTGDAALGVAVGAGAVWVVSRDGDVVRVDPDSRRVVARIPARDHSEELLDVSAGSHFVWVTNRAGSSVWKIDPRTNRVVRTIALGRVGVVPCGIAAGPMAVWVTMGSDTDCGSAATR